MDRECMSGVTMLKGAQMDPGFHLTAWTTSRRRHSRQVHVHRACGAQNGRTIRRYQAATACGSPIAALLGRAACGWALLRRHQQTFLWLPLGPECAVPHAHRQDERLSVACLRRSWKHACVQAFWSLCTASRTHLQAAARLSAVLIDVCT